MIPNDFKGGLPYLEHYYPTEEQMRNITRKEIMTPSGEWNPSLLDDTPNASELWLKKFPPSLIDATDDFYNMEGNVVLQKSDIDDMSIVSDVSSTGSGNRRWYYQVRSTKEKQKKNYGPKEKYIKWWDDKVPEIETEESNFPTQPPVRPSTA